MSKQPSLDQATYAREVRAFRSAYLHELNDGVFSLRDALENPPDFIAEMDVYDITLALRGYGRERCRILFERTGIWPHTQVDELSITAIQALVALVER
jgi:hypothetical protein